jgi:hypothetical protein
MKIMSLVTGRTSFARTQITNSHVGNKLFFSFPTPNCLAAAAAQWPKMIYITHNGDTSRRN